MCRINGFQAAEDVVKFCGTPLQMGEVFGPSLLENVSTVGLNANQGT